MHKNSLLYDGEYSGFMDQLPEELINDMLYKYLYTDFLSNFFRQFQVMKP